MDALSARPSPLAGTQRPLAECEDTMADGTGLALDRWIALGVRHELLLRLMPAVRHDMLGPVSVARMGVAVLSKRLAAEPPRLAGARAQAQELAQHLVAVTQQLRELRLWDPAQAGRCSLGAAAQQCAAWLQPSLTQQGFELELAAPPVTDPARAAPEWPRDELMFLIAGLLCHALDGWPASRLTLAWQDDSLRLSSEAPRPTPNPGPPSAAALQPIPLAALAALAVDCRAVLHAEPGQLQLQLVRAENFTPRA